MRCVNHLNAHTPNTHKYTTTGGELKLSGSERPTVVAPATLPADANGNGTGKSLSFSERVRMCGLVYVVIGWVGG